MEDNTITRYLGVHVVTGNISSVMIRHREHRWEATPDLEWLKFIK